MGNQKKRFNAILSRKHYHCNQKNFADNSIEYKMSLPQETQGHQGIRAHKILSLLLF